MMDFKAREKVWQDKALDLFKQSSIANFNHTQYDDKGLMMKYKNLVNKKTRIWWTKTSLDNYIKQKIIPRGLRIQLYPTFSLDDTELISKWESVSSACSMSFMEIINIKNASILEELDIELNKLQEELVAKLSKEALEKFFQDLNHDMEKWEQQISKNKMKKYQRDVMDYDQKKVFRWQNRISVEDQKQSEIRSSSVSSVSSISSNTTSTHEREYYTPRRIKTRYGGRGRGSARYQSNSGTRRNDKPKVINLSSHILSNEQVELLEKGLSFSPSQQLDSFTVIKDVHLFARKLILKRFHEKSTMGLSLNSEEEKAALEILESLAEESNPMEAFPFHSIYLIQSALGCGSCLLHRK
ncbi:uncharacterized protein [Dendrobates tinctorius]|uniref:uncharacterized protein n=1 Tax=Dendrobates tinctorius TaxID=92724 RepID=UPI003CC933CE